ncbi:hypothetical protein [Streptomyces sp. NPDC055709]
MLLSLPEAPRIPTALIFLLAILALSGFVLAFYTLKPERASRTKTLAAPVVVAATLAAFATIKGWPLEVALLMFAATLGTIAVASLGHRNALREARNTSDSEEEPGPQMSGWFTFQFLLAAVVLFGFSGWLATRFF